MLSSIPSPSTGSFDLGPFTLRAYGLMIALGVIAAVWFMAKRFQQDGMNPDHASGIAMWLVTAGLVGARAYHVATDWRRFEGNWINAIKIWEGGLGILGGLIFGVGAAIMYCHQKDLDLRRVLDVIAPTVPLAQLIGRWGNYFNQELFGRPTNLPWGIEIDARHRPVTYQEDATFHPTFLYESIWNLLVIFALLKIERKKKLPTGFLLIAYFGLYSIGRLCVEAIRIDEATQLGGIRINIWIFGIVAIASITAICAGIRTNQDEKQKITDAETELHVEGTREK
ncbi:MAG TPA: prolipoprotein diacylglyceryl transferase [Acidimicrobiales bacterium]|nr:prolipoprotein diacylglyceryl transferase [Acidimicrobiales bacterium]HJM96793.1 prolipoprotein diacylglyceryl transferase [Acidimicrobiales bacterium]